MSLEKGMRGNDLGVCLVGLGELSLDDSNNEGSMTVCQGSKLGGFLRGRESVLRASGGTKRSFIPVGQELYEKTTDTV